MFMNNNINSFSFAIFKPLFSFSFKIRNTVFIGWVPGIENFMVRLGRVWIPYFLLPLVDIFRAFAFKIFPKMRGLSFINPFHFLLSCILWPLKIKVLFTQFENRWKAIFHFRREGQQIIAFIVVFFVFRFINILGANSNHFSRIY